MAADRILLTLHDGHPAYFSVARDVGGGSSLDMGQIAFGEPLRAGQVLRCGTCSTAITHTEKPAGLPARQVALTYRPYLDEVAP
jgi:hypothetical protein